MVSTSNFTNELLANKESLNFFNLIKVTQVGLRRRITNWCSISLPQKPYECQTTSTEQTIHDKHKVTVHILKSVTVIDVDRNIVFDD